MNERWIGKEEEQRVEERVRKDFGLLCFFGAAAFWSVVDQRSNEEQKNGKIYVSPRIPSSSVLFGSDKKR